MRLTVSEVTLSNQEAATPDQAIYQRYPCPICQETNALQMLAIIRAGGQTSLESAYCTRCQHRFHHKFPRLSWLRDYYEKEYESRSAIPVMGRRTSLWRRARTRLARLVKHGLAQNVPNRVHDFCFGVTRSYGTYWQANPTIRKVLEIGCGFGETLRFFRDRGFDAYGTEANPVRRAHCVRDGLKVVPADFDSFASVARFAPFDFAYSVHVLEHIIDVDSHIRQLAELVRPGGFLYIETPELSGESFVLQSHTIFHVHTFTVHSMGRLLRRHGLVPVRVSADNNVQMLVQKRGSLSGKATDVPVLPQPYPAAERVPYLQELVKHSPGRFRLEWDNYHLQVQRLDPPGVLYAAPHGAFTVAPCPWRHSLICAAEEQPAADSLFPVLFDYPQLDRPPIWHKN
jgi:2-polyprenyl-3-methyl-5-hydroxy-6-metoxy-1,4-benzoquinol methylase